MPESTPPRTHASLERALATVPRGLLIGGDERPAADTATMPVENPATARTLMEVANAGLEDALAAVDAAGNAQAAWAETSARGRAELLRHATTILLERQEQFALVMTAEMGKPLAEARSEVAYAAEFMRSFSEQAAHISGSFGLSADGGTRMFVARRPVGPCLLITPWNFPLAMGARKIAPAIAAGCTVVFKPAPQTPLTALLLADVFATAGLPRGVLNVLPTSRAELVTEPMMTMGILRKLSFTGSTEVGKVLLGLAARTVMRTSMELGGNAPFIVFEDADLDVAVDAAMAAKMRNMGEACTAANRLYVHAARADEFTRRLAERMSALQVGDGLDPDTDVGPLIDRPSLDKVDRLVADAVERGANIVARGTVPAGPGHFCPPTVLTGVRADSAVIGTEIFGPIAPISTFVDEAEVIAAANATDWGLVAYVITENLQRALRVTESLEVGMVGINTGVVSNPSAPFGGVKQSGLGREGGAVGIDEYLEHQYAAVPR